jgi:hypothetical protein
MRLSENTLLLRRWRHKGREETKSIIVPALPTLVPYSSGLVI